jgi:hypothetical protein
MTASLPSRLLKLAVIAAPGCPVAAQLMSSGLFACQFWALPAEPITSTQPWSERLYRALDKRLFGARTPVSQDVLSTPYDKLAMLASCPDHIVCLVDPVQVPELPALGPLVLLQADGLPARQLDAAVRGQVGRPGGVVRLLWQVWAPGAKPRGLEAACGIDHRSVHRSIAQVLSKCPTALLGLLRRLSEGAALPEVQPLCPGVPKSAARQLASLLRVGLVWLLQRDQWWIRIYTSDGGMPTATGGVTRAQATLRPDRRSMWADPFLYRHPDGRWMVFFEDLPFATGRGHIAVIDLDDDPPRPVPVLQEPWHLSYPFLIDWEGALYMVPESSARRTVDLYLCEQFPARWRKVKTLVEGLRLADATLHFHQERWWMFATHGLPGASMNDELHIYWADELLGTWQAHALNPVRIDARDTRPAGAMFMLDGRLIRPVQDCSTRYGGALRFNEVVVLDTQAFEERDAGLLPLALSGLAPGVPVHTFNRLGARLCVDSLHAVGRPFKSRYAKAVALKPPAVS